MSDWPDYLPSELARELAHADVDFVIVGGLAVIVQASPRLTKDLDICYASDAANLERLGEVLIAANATLLGIDEDLPFVPDARTLSQLQITCLQTTYGRVDLLLSPDGAPPYAALKVNADLIDFGDFSARVASIDDLLAMKRAAGRPQDLVDVESLEIARRLRGRRRRPGR